MEEKMPTSDILWSIPVAIRLQNGTERSFLSLHDTLDFLENEWPRGAGAYHDAAVISCRNALNRQTPPAVAKELFAAACHEAGLTLRGGSREPGHQASSSIPTAEKQH
jgi:hypothetical protein